MNPINHSQPVLLGLVLLLPASLFAQAPPEPPAGYRWVVNKAFSDEFNGDELDRDKWHDHNPRWGGRPPGKFMPASVSVADGCLRIKCGVLDPPIGEFTVACGAVQSISGDALYGYYECRMKASRLTTSSTFWLTSDRKPSPLGAIKLELDIQEAIGDARRWPSFRTEMHANTHIRLSPNERGRALIEQRAKQAVFSPARQSELDAMGEQERAKAIAHHVSVLRKGASQPLRSPVDDEFHTYGCWWVDANTMRFYADGEYLFTIEPETEFGPTPFDHPMYMNLVCETYSWEAPPTVEALQDDSRNTTLYDYVRSYTLEKTD